VTVQVFEEMADQLTASLQGGEPMGYEIINVRE